jgi:ADP-heptose:LPS heptosyltransferase
MKKNFQKILIIQTAFIGDVILATSLIEKMHQYYPDADLHFLLRKGNESILQNHPHLQKIYIWDKQKDKYKNLWKILRQVRKQSYDLVIDVQRFATMGLFAGFSKAKEIVCFDKNPFSWLATHQVKHLIQAGIHEVQRNHTLIENYTDKNWVLPKIYPQKTDYEQVVIYQTQPYICIAPTSVWFTKQFPKEKWIDFLKTIPAKYNVFLLGAKTDFQNCEEMIQKSMESDKANDENQKFQNKSVQNLAGKLTLLQSAALMQSAEMNYVNDSAPLHLCSATNAPTCAIFCSTVPEFGFYPLSEKAFVIETLEKLPCRPCGLHGKSECPEKHFKCAKTIDNQRLIEVLN